LDDEPGVAVMAGDDEYPQLGPDFRDRAASVARGVGAIVPHGGRFIGNLIGSIVPGQRINRLESYVAILKGKLEGIGESQERIIASSPEHIDLFEEGAFRAARALTQERIKHFALIVAIGMTKGTSEAIAQKRLLTILSELDEQDIIMLHWRIRIDYLDAGVYADNHPELLKANWPPATVFSPREDREANALREAIDNKLIRYNLTELVEDKTWPGSKSRRTERITELGRLILRTVGLIDNETLA